ncbi:MAG: MFS transporter [Burkholderiaceae bacterium]|nr:MFS transporter [Burkholderiaceae bacterium]
MTAAVPHRVGLYVAVVQFFFALTWTVYVIYLPQLAAQAGIPKSAVIWLLMLDQFVFLLSDYACGVASDRMARLNGRIGPAVLAITVLSCAAFLLLPFIAPQGSATLFIAVTVLWTLGSSALRAPPLNIIGRYAAKPSQPGLVALMMLGLGLAAAVSPYLGVALREVDPRWPFALASVALATTTLGIVAAERALQGRQPATGTPTPDAPVKSDPLRLPWVPCLVAVALAAIAFQVHVFLNSTPLYLRHATASDLQMLAPVFWIGFNLGLWPASRATKRHGAMAVMGTAGLAAAAASACAAGAGTIGPLVAAQAIAGAAWAGLLMGAFSTALALGHTGAEGRFSGALSSTLALATLLRMALLASGLTSLPSDGALRLALDWVPTGLWLLAGALLLAVWQRRSHAGLRERVR